MAVISRDVQRLNWGCGPRPARGWINADHLRAPGIALPGDIRDGLPVADDVVDYAVAIPGLQDLPYLDVVPALQELRRVLRPGGILRLGLPISSAASPRTRAVMPATFTFRMGK